MPPVPHLLFLCRCHIVPLFGSDESSVSIKEQSAFIHDGFRDFTAERNICTRDEVCEQRLREDRAFQERFVTERDADPFCIGVFECWQCCL